jgi:putative component of membrane protein insertase Oxa1/YidC/SpoIIIJ protein YidD
MLTTSRLKKINKVINSVLNSFAVTCARLGLTAIALLLITGCCGFPLQGLAPSQTCPADELSPLSGLILFYQGPMDHLSSVRFGDCPMFPHCSEYALSAIQKHGMIIGWFMTCDRLMRCGRDEMDLSPQIIVDGKVKAFDPLDRNDEWLTNDRL